MISLNACPVCNSDLITYFQKAGFAPEVVHEIMPGVKVNAVVISRYYRCLNCNVIFQNPRLSETDLDKFYSQGYYRSLLNLTEEQIDKDELFRTRVDSGIIKQNIKEIKSHLDVGCSRGFLLESVGAKIQVGVEENLNWVKAENIEIYNTIDKVPQKTFDLVTAIHVLEHTLDPQEFLDKMVKFVSSRGRLVIEVPTWDSPGGSSGPLRLAHLYHFEQPVLVSMCKKAGLSIVSEHHTPHLIFILKKK